MGVFYCRRSTPRPVRQFKKAKTSGKKLGDIGPPFPKTAPIIRLMKNGLG